LVTAIPILVGPVAPVKGLDGTAVDILINQPQTPPVGEGRIGYQALLLEIVAGLDESMVIDDVRVWYSAWIPKFAEWVVFVSGLVTLDDTRALVKYRIATTYSGVPAAMLVPLGVERSSRVNTWPQNAVAITDDMMHMKVEDYEHVF
jgi:hypothetical protein